MGQTGSMTTGGANSAMGASMAISALSSITTAFSQANALKATGTYQQSVAETNAKIAGLKGTEVLEAGDLAAASKASQTGQVVGAMRAAQAGSGTDVRSGSNVLTRASANLAGRMDELMIRTNAARQAWGFKTQALSDTYQAQFARLTASNEAQQTILSGGIQAIQQPLAIYANNLRWSRYMGGNSGTGQPYDLRTT